MSFARKMQRAAAKRAARMLLVPVLNDPTRRVEIPLGLRDAVLDEYEIKPSALVGPSSFHVVFVEEGVLFGFIAQTEDGGARVILHEFELTNEDTKQLFGKAIFDFWKGLPVKITTAEMHERYHEYIKNLSVLSA